MLLLLFFEVFNPSNDIKFKMTTKICETGAVTSKATSLLVALNGLSVYENNGSGKQLDCLGILSYNINLSTYMFYDRHCFENSHFIVSDVRFPASWKLTVIGLIF